MRRAHETHRRRLRRRLLGISPAIVTLDDPLPLAAGEGLTFSCTFKNPGDEWIVFGTGEYGEMCAIMASYAFPRSRPHEVPPSLIYRDGHSAPLIETEGGGTTGS